MKNPVNAVLGLPTHCELSNYGLFYKPDVQGFQALVPLLHWDGDRPALSPDRSWVIKRTELCTDVVDRIDPTRKATHSSTYHAGLTVTLTVRPIPAPQIKAPAVPEEMALKRSYSIKSWEASRAFSWAVLS